MNYEITTIVVTDSKLFNRTGDFGRWAARVESTFTRHAIAEAPHGADSGRVNKTSGLPPGLLKAGIHGEVHRVGVRHFQTVIHSAAPYTLAVLRGTGTIIKRGEGGRFAAAEKGEGMYIPANPGWGRARWRQRVSGQSANNFFERAFTATGRSHSSIRGFSMPG